MTEEQIALARRAVACRGWRWMAGMLTACSVRVIEGGGGYIIGHRQGATREGGGWVDAEDAGYLPDLTDPATLGCLLALVREAWSNAIVIRIGNGWFHVEVDERDWYDHNTSSLLAALVAALEAAP
ncbi:MAG: hypothetical protein RLZZ299_789 [Pseudomonadota bacterium]